MFAAWLGRGPLPNQARVASVYSTGFPSSSVARAASCVTGAHPCSENKFGFPNSFQNVSERRVRVEFFKTSVKYMQRKYSCRKFPIV